MSTDTAVVDLTAAKPDQLALVEGPPLDLTPYTGGAEVAIADRMTMLVKGRSLARTDKSLFSGDTPAPLTEPEAFSQGMSATKAFLGAVKTGFADADGVRKSLNPHFTSQFGAFFAAGSRSPQAIFMQQVLAEVERMTGQTVSKSFTTSSPLATGLVPYNLARPCVS